MPRRSRVRSLCSTIVLVLASAGCAAEDAGAGPAPDEGPPPEADFTGTRTTPLDVVVLSSAARDGEVRAGVAAQDAAARGWVHRFHRPGATVVDAVKVHELAPAARGGATRVRAEWHATRVLAGDAVAPGADFVVEQAATGAARPHPSVCGGLDAPDGAARIVVVAPADAPSGGLPAVSLVADDDGHLGYAVPVADGATVRWHDGPIARTIDVGAEVSRW
jgi:hypothetical protein